MLLTGGSHPNVNFRLNFFTSSDSGLRKHTPGSCKVIAGKFRANKK